MSDVLIPKDVFFGRPKYDWEARSPTAMGWNYLFDVTHSCGHIQPDRFWVHVDVGECKYLKEPECQRRAVALATEHMKQVCVKCFMAKFGGRLPRIELEFRDGTLVLKK